MKKQTNVFTKASEWIAAGNMKTGLYLLECVERETEKAVGFKAEKHTEFGRPYSTTCWFPKSKLQEIENDFYVSGPAKMFLVPGWLYCAKTEEGFFL